MTTGPVLNGTASANDVDGGTTRVRSAAIRLPADPGDLTFRWFFGTYYNSTAHDYFRVLIEGANGARTRVLVQTGTPRGLVAQWRTATVSLNAWANQRVRVIVEATDGGPDSLVEAGIDDVRVQRP
jgi:aminopeptidase S